MSTKKEWVGNNLKTIVLTAAKYMPVAIVTNVVTWLRVYGHCSSKAGL